jgi:DNA-binding transcriptional MerR regulator
MNSPADAPVYNLKAVVRETRLKPDTIRAWERRYGLPEPRRTDSGHRLYSQNEINMLKWLVARQNEGMSISRAVVLWRRLQENNLDRAEPALYGGMSLAATVGDPTTLPAATDIVAQLRAAWLNACLLFDEQTAERVLSHAFAILPTEMVCLTLIQRGLAAIGDGWYQGRITVQQEHFASALTTRRMEALLAATPVATRPNRILVGCPAEENHTLPPLLLALLLRRRGWDVIFLGADIPLADLIATVRTARPQLVILVAQQLVTAATLLEMGQLLVNERVPLGFGGAIFTQIPELRPRIAGHYLGDQLDAAPQAVENVLAAPRIQNALTPVAHEYPEALHSFKVSIAQIEADVWQAVGAGIMAHEQLAHANQYISRNIMAALTFGSMSFLQPAIIWLRDLLIHHGGVSEQALAFYLQAYQAAVESQLHERGAMIAKGLNELAHADLWREQHPPNLLLSQSPKRNVQGI